VRFKLPELSLENDVAPPRQSLGIAELLCYYPVSSREFDSKMV
jgi:hypothetical protein